MSRRLIPLLLTLAVLCVIAAPAAAQRQLLTTEALRDNPKTSLVPPPPEGEIEDACGLAIAPGGGLYVSDYYHGVVDLFGPDGTYISQSAAGLHPEGPCGLAIDPSGRLYVNLWHQSALRLSPSLLSFDPGHVTGIAVDPATEYLYVDHHNFEHPSIVSVYRPDGTPLEEGGLPLEIGAGTLGDAYGVAVDAGRVYVADATDQQIEVFKPALDPTHPAFTIGGFNSLIDASLAIDPTNGHLLVVDNTQPGYEHPIAAIYEFEADGTPLGRLTGQPLFTQPVFGKPSGIAVDPESGTLFVTDGNSEFSNVFAYGPYEAVPAAAQPSDDALESNAIAAAVPQIAADAPQADPPLRPRADLRKNRRPHRRTRRHQHHHHNLGGRR